MDGLNKQEWFQSAHSLGKDNSGLFDNFVNCIE